MRQDFGERWPDSTGSTGGLAWGHRILGHWGREGTWKCSDSPSSVYRGGNRPGQPQEMGQARWRKGGTVAWARLALRKEAVGPNQILS